MTITPIDVVTGRKAIELIGNDSFLTQWRDLYRECPHATAFQAPGFVTAWYEAYQDQWQPIIVQSKDSSGYLIGLWLLAYNPKTNELSHAGTHQAEYQVWLTRPGWDLSFLTAAWAELKRCIPFKTLRQKYLPNSQLGDLLQSTIGIENRIVLRTHIRPLVILNQNVIDASYERGSHKRQLNRLNKLGKLEFERLRNPEEFERILETIIDFYDFRKGAVNHIIPFRDDPHKRSFHADLFAAAPSEVCATVTYLNRHPIAAFWGSVSGNVVHGGMLMHSPFLAKYSPGKIHVVQLSEHLFHEGVKVLDLTPGGDRWKERFINAHDEVVEATIYRSRQKGIENAVRDRLKRWAKRFAARARITPSRVRSAGAYLRRVRPSSVGRKIKSWFSLNRDCRVYRADRALASKFHNDPRIKCNSIHDLLFFESQKGWKSRDPFLSDALERLERGESVYTICMNDRLAHHGWMIVGQTESYMDIVKQSMKIPPNCVTLYDFYSNPEFRGQGLYRATLGHMLCLAFSDEKTEYAYIQVLANNLPSRHVIEKMGFEYQGSFHLQRRFGIEKKWESSFRDEGDKTNEK